MFFKKLLKEEVKETKLTKGLNVEKNFGVSPVKKIVENLFTLRSTIRDENFYLLQGLVKILLISLYGVQVRKDINESYKCKSQNRMETQYVDNVLAFGKYQTGTL